VKNILVIGGSGFWERDRARTGAPSRQRRLLFHAADAARGGAKHLTVLPTARVIEADVHDPATLARLMAGQDAVISLVGILKGGEGEPYGRAFARAHVELPRKIAAAARAAGVRRVLHVSALKAAADAPSGYLRSKADGEAALTATDLDLTIFRPSVIFGRGDAFLTLFARMAKIAPFFPAGRRHRALPAGLGRGCRGDRGRQSRQCQSIGADLRSVRTEAVCAGRFGALRERGMPAIRAP
jgi:uncharacterized protein YbjT (DUF2867 family)